MSEEEQLQLKKDTLWDIHMAEKRIACLERKLDMYMEAYKAVYDAWERGCLGEVTGRVVVHRQDGRPSESLKNPPDRADMIATVADLEKSKEEREKLQKSFDKM